jgi:hypothetical protein
MMIGFESGRDVAICGRDEATGSVESVFEESHL